MKWTQSKKTLMLLCASASITAITAQSANAAFFALREQSAYSQGASFAGASAQRNALSSSFFNPAIITEFKGLTVEGTASVILPFTDADTTANPGTVAATGGALGPVGSRPTTNNIGSDALLPASYTSFQINEHLWAGFAVNSPFGLATRSAPGSLEALSSQDFRAFTLNFQPTIAYKVNEHFSIAAGVQGQYIDVQQITGILSPAVASNAELDANGVSFGFLLGATIKPTDKTTIGIGYRSQMDVDLDGTLVLNDAGGVAGNDVSLGSATADLALPDIVNVGITHKFSDRFTGLAQFSWENWSRLQSVQVINSGAVAAEFDFGLSDSFFYSVGGEFQASDHIKLRAGIAYETSPTNDQDRSLALADNDRLWFSTGGTYKATKHIELDLAATWVRVERDTVVSNSFGVGAGPVAGLPIAAGTADSNVIIFSAGTRVRF